MPIDDRPNLADRLSRRDLLAGFGAGAAAVSTGCLGSSAEADQPGNATVPDGNSEDNGLLGGGSDGSPLALDKYAPGRQAYPNFDQPTEKVHLYHPRNIKSKYPSSSVWEEDVNPGPITQEALNLLDKNLEETRAILTQTGSRFVILAGIDDASSELRGRGWKRTTINDSLNYLSKGEKGVWFFDSDKMLYATGLVSENVQALSKTYQNSVPSMVEGETIYPEIDSKLHDDQEADSKYMDKLRGYSFVFDEPILKEGVYQGEAIRVIVDQEGNIEKQGPKEIGPANISRYTEGVIDNV